MQLHQALPIRQIFIVALALVFLSGPDAVAQNQISEGTVATVDGIAITYNDVSLVEDELMAVYGQLPEEQRFQTLVGYMVNRILASEAAKKAGLENDADVAKIKAFMERKALQDVYIAKMLMERVREEDVTAYYDKEIKNGPVEEEVRARHILLDNSEAADAVVADLENGADFAALAKERSKGPSGPSGGDLGYFSKQSMVPAFSDAAFKLAAGETSPPVQTQFGWHVIRVEDRRKRPVPPFDQVRDQIYQLLISEAQRDIYDIVLAANRAAIDACRPGNHFNQPHEAATLVLVEGLIELGLLQGDSEQLIAQGDHEKYCPHKTSHWLGLDVHDVGDYRLGNLWRDLMPGMVLTVEPGIYIPRDDSTAEIAEAYRGLGIRIEDAVLIQKQGCQVLTEGLIKDPDDIEAWMATRADRTDMTRVVA